MPFQKGQSGNPGGRPKKTEKIEQIQALAREHAPDALNALVKVAKNGKSESARVAAATALLDRGFGKPQQSVTTTVTHADPDRLTDAELAAIAAGHSSADDSQAARDTSKLN